MNALIPIALVDLILDAGTQIRSTINADTVARYADAIMNKEKLPAPVVMSDSASYWLVDGFHRVMAYQQLSRKQILCDLRSGTLADAIALACAANQEHDTAGLARSNADKRRAVETLLTLEEWRGKSQAMVAEHVGVHQTFVSKVKAQLNTELTYPEMTTGKDGKQYPATRPRTSPRVTRGDDDLPLIPAEPPDEQRLLHLEAQVQYRNGKDLKPIYTVPEWNGLTPAQQDHLLHASPKGSFNDQTTANIEWALWSWNPITGCEHTCPYCYARDIAERFYQGYGFTPVFHPSRLHIPTSLKPPLPSASLGERNVFVCSMADLFGKWVPREWIQSVIDECAAAKAWNFLFLTKFPTRLAEFEFPDNAWVGTSVDAQARVAAAEKAFRKVNANVKWLSCEPLLEPLSFSSLSMFDWLVLGGASESTATPEWHPPRQWVEDLEYHARKAGLKIYEKTNLLKRFREYPGNETLEITTCDWDYPILQALNR